MTSRFGLACILAAASALTMSTPLAGGPNKPSDSQEKTTMSKAPSLPAQMYAVKTARSIDGIIKDLRSGNKNENLMSGNGIGCRVFIQHEQDVTTNQAEVHDGADDIFVIMEGTATFILGGQLDAPQQVQPGEWRASGITGGKEFKVSKGDVILVPRGTPHKRVTAGQDITLMIVKAFTPAGK